MTHLVVKCHIGGGGGFGGVGGGGWGGVWGTLQPDGSLCNQMGHFTTTFSGISGWVTLQPLKDSVGRPAISLRETTWGTAYTLSI